MVAQPLWRGLKTLSEIDLQRKEITEKLEKLEAQIREEREIIPELRQTLEDLKREKIDARKMVDAEELRANELQIFDENKRDSLDRVKNDKAYAAIQKEIKTISERRHEQDSVLEKAWYHLEEVTKALDSTTEKNEKRILQLEEACKEHEAKLVEQRKVLGDLDGSWNNKMEGIPNEWIERYKKMHSHVDDPVVAVLGSSCSSCYYSVPPQDMFRLKKSDIVSCRNCYRLLYYDKQEEQDSKSESF
jgi:predicted  nucleic acid-binding Zn-ribbon protein